jgi:hypothetical protein
MTQQFELVSIQCRFSLVFSLLFFPSDAQAVDYGMQHMSHHYTDMVHVAIALYYYGMISLHQDN